MLVVNFVCSSGYIAHNSCSRAGVKARPTKIGLIRSSSCMDLNNDKK